MPLATINAKPRSMPRIARILADKSRQWVLMDIGARGGISANWTPLKSCARVIGFDPDPEECRRLNQSGAGVEYFPHAIHGRDGQFPFYLTELEYCHGFYPCAPDYLERFPNAINNAVR